MYTISSRIIVQIFIYTFIMLSIKEEIKIKNYNLSYLLSRLYWTWLNEL